MTPDEILSMLKEELGDQVLGWDRRSETRLYVEVTPAAVPDSARLLFGRMGARFQIATGTDTPTAIEILYHWAFDGRGFVVSVRTRLDREAPEIESLAGICTGCEWIEREMWELLGITFRGHPDMRHLLLRQDWPEGKYPLRRDYAGLDS